MKYIACLILAPVILHAGTAKAEWRLMGRHGGCATLAEAAARKDILKGISSPQDLADRLRAQGEKVGLTETKGPRGAAVFVEAPGQGLSLIFVPAELCGVEKPR